MSDSRFRNETNLKKRLKYPCTIIGVFVIVLFILFGKIFQINNKYEYFNNVISFVALFITLIGADVSKKESLYSKEYAKNSKEYLEEVKKYRDISVQKALNREKIEKEKIDKVHEYRKKDSKKIKQELRNILDNFKVLESQIEQEDLKNVILKKKIINSYSFLQKQIDYYEIIISKENPNIINTINNINDIFDSYLNNESSYYVTIKVNDFYKILNKLIELKFDITKLKI